MSIDDKLLSRLEKLSSLKIKDENREAMESSLSDILSFVDNINSVDVSDISATFTTVEGGTPMQEDEPVSNPQIAKNILENAPAKEDTFFLVPKIIE
jgi:aspartyl-tRNA(Asn)/glutamyl-tRNA(Gln) amidotransferase subunit C